MSDEQEIILVWLCISFFSLVEMVPMQIIVFILESCYQAREMSTFTVGGSGQGIRVLHVMFLVW